MMTRTMALVIKKTPSMMGWKNRPNAGKRKLDSFGTTDVYLIGINIKDPAGVHDLTPVVMHVIKYFIKVVVLYQRNQLHEYNFFLAVFQT